MLAPAISAIIPLMKDSGYHEIPILGVIEWLVIQCQGLLSQVFLKDLEMNWLHSPTWHNICWIYMSEIDQI